MTATPSNKPNPLAAKPGTQGIDPRGPRFGATITLILLTIELVLLLSGTSVTSSDSLAQIVTSPSIWLLTFIVVIFAIGAFAGIQKHPYGAIFKAVIRPRLQAPRELEDPKPPTFAQLIGFIISAIGLVFALLGLTTAAVIAVAFAFVAAFLNSVFAFCLGCQIYVLLVRAGIVGGASNA
jgi:hypothetical protein